VTGDVKYHDAQRARSEGLTLVDAGHFATEIPMVQHLTEELNRVADERQWPVEFIQSKGEQDSFSWI
jgi:putative NIF3 family GTP cyclohydrolase 1 type 2